MSEGREDGGPAFPIQQSTGASGAAGGGGQQTHFGMSLRDWFAGQALAGMTLSASPALDKNYDDAKRMATVAYRYADAMLEARARTEPKP